MRHCKTNLLFISFTFDPNTTVGVSCAVVGMGAEGTVLGVFGFDDEDVAPDESHWESIKGLCFLGSGAELTSPSELSVSSQPPAPILRFKGMVEGQIRGGRRSWIWDPAVFKSRCHPYPPMCSPLVHCLSRQQVASLKSQFFLHRTPTNSLASKPVLEHSSTLQI